MKKLLFILSLLLLWPGLGLAATELNTFVEFTGEAAGDGAGSGLSIAGDVNGDGYDDFLIGASTNDDAANNAGAAYLIYGSATKLTSIDLSDSSVVKFSGENAGDLTGSRVSAAGDVNGDGYDDFLISTTSKDASAGAAYLIYGKSAAHTSLSLSDSSVVEFSGESAGDYAGDNISAAGDINQDGYDDFLISASGDDDNGDGAGAVYIIYGQATQLTSTSLSSGSIIKITGENAGDGLASGLTAGDLNGDGYTDIIMNAPNNNDAAAYAGKIYVIYGQAPPIYSGVVDTLASASFTGEAAQDFVGGSMSAEADVNGDSYADLLIGAANHDGDGANSGAAYLIYGQADTLSSVNLNDSSVIKFTGEEAGDIAGIDLTLIPDVNGDGYGDIFIGASMDDTNAADAGAAYLIYGQADTLTSMDLSDSSIEKFLGQDSMDIAGDVIGSSGDINGDGFSELLLSAYYRTGQAANDGVTYLGYLYMDEDGDGIAGDGGIFDGEDCDDSDSDINPNKPEIQDDETDNNCDGEIDEVNTDDTHPDYEDYDPTTEDLHDATIASVEGGKRGNIKVTYSDNSIYRYNIFNISLTKLTKVKHYQDTGYYTVLHPQAKRIAFVNIYSGEVLDNSIINKNVAYKYNSSKIFNGFRDRDYAVISSRKSNGEIRVAVIRIKPNKEAFGKKVASKFVNEKVRVSKTKRNKNKILLKNKNSKNLQRYLFTKKYNLKSL